MPKNKKNKSAGKGNKNAETGEDTQVSNTETNDETVVSENKEETENVENNEELKEIEAEVEAVTEAKVEEKAEEKVEEEKEVTETTHAEDNKVEFNEKPTEEVKENQEEITSEDKSQVPPEQEVVEEVPILDSTEVKPEVTEAKVDIPEVKEEIIPENNPTEEQAEHKEEPINAPTEEVKEIEPVVEPVQIKETEPEHKEEVHAVVTEVIPVEPEIKQEVVHVEPVHVVEAKVEEIPREEPKHEHDLNAVYNNPPIVHIEAHEASHNENKPENDTQQIKEPEAGTTSQEARENVNVIVNENHQAEHLPIEKEKEAKADQESHTVLPKEEIKVESKLNVDEERAKNEAVSKPTRSKDAPKKESTASEKAEKFSSVPNNFSEENKIKTPKKQSDMNVIDKIDIDKENDNVKDLRRLNSQSEDSIPKKKNERGFCTKCNIY